MLTSRRTLLFAAASMLGCDNKAQTAPQQRAQPSEASLLRADRIEEVLEKLLAQLNRPVRILSVTATRSQVVLHMQDPKRPTTVIEYRYRDGSVTAPVGVKLFGKGKLKDNLFRLSSADPRNMARVVSSVRKTSSKPIRKLVMKRNLPRSRDIQFRAHLGSLDLEEVIAADKHGKLLGQVDVDETAPAEKR